MIDPRAVAVQGIGYGPALVALQGFGEIEQPATGGGWGWWPAPRKRRREDEDEAPQIEAPAPLAVEPEPQPVRRAAPRIAEPAGPTAAQVLDAIAARSQVIREAIEAAQLADRIELERRAAARRRRNAALLLLMN